MQQRDYIERLIEELAEGIARALGVGPAGRRSRDEALRDLDALWTSSVGLRRADAERLDDGSLRAMLGAKAVLAAKLFEALAALEDEVDPARAAALRRRASKLAMP